MFSLKVTREMSEKFMDINTLFDPLAKARIGVLLIDYFLPSSLMPMNVSRNEMIWVAKSDLLRRGPTITKRDVMNRRKWTGPGGGISLPITQSFYIKLGETS